jgi:hypothetical protein
MNTRAKGMAPVAMAFAVMASVIFAAGVFAEDPGENRASRTDMPFSEIGAEETTTGGGIESGRPAPGTETPESGAEDDLPKTDMEDDVPEIETDTETPLVFKVSVPLNIHVVLDPFMMSEKGTQIFNSERTIIENIGDVPAEVFFRFTATLGDNVVYQSNPNEIDINDFDNTTKEIYLELSASNGLTLPFVQVDARTVTAELTVSLDAANAGTELNFNGRMSCYADEKWDDGDVDISGVYTIFPPDREPRTD